VPKRLAHVGKVVVFPPRADALLWRGGSHVGPPLQPQEHVLELNHARIDEKQARVLFGDEGGARHNGVPVAGEELQE